MTAAVAVGEWSGYKDLLAVDMGGTSYDVCLIKDGQPDIGVDSWVSRYRVATPMIDIHSIGTGGGSIAWIDEGGALRVGPRSAGSDPGPACYGRGGTKPTVTDANLVLGYLNPGAIGGGEIKLNTQAAFQAIEKEIAQPLGMTVEDAASGIFRISNSAMTNAIRYVSVSRGTRPPGFRLDGIRGRRSRTRRSPGQRLGCQHNSCAKKRRCILRSGLYHFEFQNFESQKLH